MKPIFEAKYIHIIWADRDTAFSIKESNDEIRINVINNARYQLDVTTYSKINKSELGQIAIHLLNASDESVPYFKINNTENSKLRSVTDNLTGKIWWIEDGKWSKSNKRWQSEIFRSVGEVVVTIGLVQCTIHIRSSSFTYKQLELYLQDFVNDFWHLILNESSYVQAEGKKNKSPQIMDSSSPEYIEKFIDFASRVIQNPKKELREIQLLQDYKKVRPVPRTFMEIATKGQQRILTSRGYNETYNIAENKYIYHIVNRICILLKNLNKVVNYSSKYHSKRLLNYQERMSGFSDIKTIDKEVFENEIAELKKQVTDEKVQLKNALESQDHKMNLSHFKKVSIVIRLRNRTNHEDFIGFFGDAKNKVGDEWISFADEKYINTKYENCYYMFFFERNVFKDILVKFNGYEIVGYVEKEDILVKNRIQLKRKFVYILDIKVIRSKIQDKLKSRNSIRGVLEAKNWKEPLSRNEKKEQEYEILSITTAMELSLKQQGISTELEKSIKPLLSKLTKLKSKCKKLKIEPDSYFPNSMTFIQNPNYQGAQRLYKQILGLTGLDEDLFLGLQEIEKIGILNISLIYERWCLLQIIKILTDTYKFIPEEKWKRKLIEQTLDSGINIKIYFENNDINRNITLWYEKELRSGKRPDFVLDVQSTFSGDNTRHRLVMDAKFYENINDKSLGGISTVINQLYNEKNYSEDTKNSVFVLHPSKQSVPQKKSPQKWANNSYYGEVSMFDWDDNNPNHKYGAILLSPVIRGGNYLDDLHRLIGMYLQYGIEQNSSILGQDNKFNPLTKEKLFCLVCGSDSYTWSKQDTPKGYKYWVTCTECHHFTTYSYCANCQNRLIKHGDYWTYHSTQALEPTNIKCPSCGELL